MEADDIQRRLASVERALEALVIELRLVARRQAIIDRRMREIVDELQAQAKYSPTRPPGPQEGP